MIKWQLTQILKSRYTTIAIGLFMAFNIVYFNQLLKGTPIQHYRPDYYFYNIFYTGNFTPFIIVLFIFLSSLIYTLETIMTSDSYELMITQRTNIKENIKSRNIAIFIATFLVLMVIMYVLHSFIFIYYHGEAIYLFDIPDELAFNSNIVTLVKYPQLLTLVLTLMAAIVFASINSLIYNLSSRLTINRKLDKFLIPLLITTLPIFILGIYRDYSLFNMLHFDIYNEDVNQLTESLKIFVTIMFVLVIEFIVFSRLLPIIERIFYKGKIKQELKGMFNKISSRFEGSQVISILFLTAPYIIFAALAALMLDATKSGFNTNTSYLGNSLEVFLTTRNPVFRPDLNEYVLLWLPNMILLVTVILLIIRFSSIYFDDAIILFRTRFSSGFAMYRYFFYKMIIYTTKLFFVYLLASVFVFREYDFSGMIYYYLTMYLIFITLTTMVFAIRIRFETKIALVLSIAIFVAMYSMSVESSDYLGIYYREIVQVFNNNMGSYWYKLVIPYPVVTILTIYGLVISGLLSLSYLLYIIKYKEYKLLWLK